jgi:aminopeptidase N
LQRQPESEDLSWWIPYNFVVQNTPDFTQTTPDGWIQQGVNHVTLIPTTSKTWTENEWMIFNKQQTGYYRVNYDSRLWQLITDELVLGDYSKIHVLNRAQLIDDMYAFARVDQVTYTMVFDLLDYLSNELDYAPWAPADRVLNMIDRRMASLESYNNFKVNQNFISDVFF